MFTRKSVAYVPVTSSDTNAVLRADSLTNMRANKIQAAGLVLCVLAFLACILLTVTPLMRMPDPVLSLHIGWGAWLGRASGWLPQNLGSTYQPSSASIEFFSLISLAVLCYLLGALLVRRWKDTTRLGMVHVCVWLGLLLAGGIYVMTPGVLSHDTMVYAGYSRLMAVYHANPYFNFFSDFPRDPLISVDQWSHVNAIYGPIWLLVCCVPGFLVRPTPEAYLVAFRLFALAMHLINTWLVERSLRIMGSSPRTRVLGTLLYGWNPLVLLESALNGHNDVFLLTFVLLGVFLVARAEQRGELLLARGYLPPAIAFTLAALVKFAILPVIAVYLLFLTCKALRVSAGDDTTWKQSLRGWRLAARLVGGSFLVVLLVALVFYVPFWFGQNMHAIITSFTNNPAASYGENSLMRSVVNWLPFHPEQQHNPLWLFLSQRHVWDNLTYLAILLCLLLSVCQFWRTPTVRVLVTMMLALMCVVLLLTPWFFTWYVTWIAGLAIVCLPALTMRSARAFFAMALTFSYSALSLYLFNQNLLGPSGYLVSFFDILPPLCAFVLCWWFSSSLFQKNHA